MQSDDVKRLYDADYAATYDEKFLFSPSTAADAEFEVELVGRLLEGGPEWLDVACGTGYFLSRFPQARRVGSDLSPAMLEKARRAAPGVPLFEHDFRRARPEWDGRFGLVSCMWYAYSLVETMNEVAQVIDNLADWTSASGTCFLPVGDARLISLCNLPYEVPRAAPGRVVITGILWSFVEDGGEKVHAHLVTPQMEWLVERFERRFRSVEVIRYPFKANGVDGRPAIIARNKR